MFSDDLEWDFAISIFIHDKIIEASGGFRGIHDENMIKSAIARPLATAFGVEQYVTHFDKAAALLSSIANNHGFKDGNKRTAMALASFYLDRHCIEVSYSNQEYEDFMLRVVNEKPDNATIASWLQAHSDTLES